MTMNSKVYVVIEFGGQDEDTWEHIIGVCSTSEIADKLKAQIEEKHTSFNCAISEEDWESITAHLDEAVEAVEELDDEVSEIKKLFPKYSEKDIRQAIELYVDSCLDWEGVMIKEIDFYTKLSDDYAN